MPVFKLVPLSTTPNSSLTTVAPFGIELADPHLLKRKEVLAILN